jgi:ABC-type oligopeptide transport system substrate-binding subunit
MHVPQLGTAYLGFGTSQPPFDDRRVRRAFALGTDRERLVNVDLGATYAVVATGGCVPPGMPGHQPGIALPYDPERARRLLAEAGYPGGRGFPSTVGLAASAMAPWAKALRRQWQETLGVDVPWEIVDWTAYLERLAIQPPQLYGMGWVADYPDPDSLLRVSDFLHDTRWRHRGYDRLVKEAWRLPDWEVRLRLYERAEQILLEEVPILPMSYGGTAMLVKPWVTRYPMSAVRQHFWEEAILEPH